MVEKTEMPEKKRFFSEGLAKVFKIDTKRVVLAIVCVHERPSLLNDGPKITL